MEVDDQDFLDFSYVQKFHNAASENFFKVSLQPQIFP